MLNKESELKMKINNNEFTSKTTLKEFMHMSYANPLLSILKMLRFLTFSVIVIAGYYWAGVLGSIGLLLILTGSYMLCLQLVFVFLSYLSKLAGK